MLSRTYSVLFSLVSFFRQFVTLGRCSVATQCSAVCHSWGWCVPPKRKTFLWGYCSHSWLNPGGGGWLLFDFFACKNGTNKKSFKCSFLIKWTFLCLPVRDGIILQWVYRKFCQVFEATQTKKNMGYLFWNTSGKFIGDGPNGRGWNPILNLPKSNRKWGATMCWTADLDFRTQSVQLVVPCYSREGDPGVLSFGEEFFFSSSGLDAKKQERCWSFGLRQIFGLPSQIIKKGHRIFGDPPHQGGLQGTRENFFP